MKGGDAESAESGAQGRALGIAVKASEDGLLRASRPICDRASLRLKGRR
jgi:hypothetical protein